jgi:hypothetical protein
MKVLTSVFLCLFILGSIALVYAEDEDLKGHPGYVDLGEIKIPDKAGEVTEVLLGPAMLRLISMADDDEDDDLAKTISELKGIQVKTFEIDSLEAGKILPIMDRIEDKLKRDGWERLVLVKDQDERVVVSIKPEGDKAVGLMVMTLEPGDEAAFVNIIGTLDFNSFSEMDINLDQSVLDSLEEHMGKGE